MLHALLAEAQETVLHSKPAAVSTASCAQPACASAPLLQQWVLSLQVVLVLLCVLLLLPARAQLLVLGDGLSRDPALQPLLQPMTLQQHASAKSLDALQQGLQGHWGTASC